MRRRAVAITGGLWDSTGGGGIRKAAALPPVPHGAATVTPPVEGETPQGRGAGPAVAMALGRGSAGGGACQPVAMAMEAGLPGVGKSVGRHSSGGAACGCSWQRGHGSGGGAGLWRGCDRPCPAQPAAAPFPPSWPRCAGGLQEPSRPWAPPARPHFPSPRAPSTPACRAPGPGHAPFPCSAPAPFRAAGSQPGPGPSSSRPRGTI